MLMGLWMVTLPPESAAMGNSLQQKPKDEFWKNVEEAMPRIKQKADAVLQQLNYDPAKLSGVVFLKGEGGDEAWTVKYKYGIATRDDLLGKHGDLEAYVNNRGVVKRVVKFEDGHEQLLYGKDERIVNGMTPDQVRERLGEPDHKGSPPRAFRALADEMWKYKASPYRTVRIEVFFKDGKVASVDTFGE